MPNSKSQGTKPQSEAQKKKVERVMHEFKEGELETSQGKQVKNRKQAIAIALSEAGASKYASEEQNRRNREEAEASEGGESRRQRSRRRGSRPPSTGAAEKSKAELYRQAKERDIPGRSRMSKDELANALHK